MESGPMDQTPHTSYNDEPIPVETPTPTVVIVEPDSELSPERHTKADQILAELKTCQIELRLLMTDSMTRSTEQQNEISNLRAEIQNLNERLQRVLEHQVSPPSTPQPSVEIMTENALNDEEGPRGQRTDNHPEGPTQKKKRRFI